MGNLKDILRQHTATPSVESWNKISQHLDHVMPTNSSSSSAVQSTSNAVKSLAAKVSLKTIGALSAALLTVGAATTLWITSHNTSSKNPPSQNTITTDTVPVVPIDTLEKSTSLPSPLPATTNPPTNSTIDNSPSAKPTPLERTPPQNNSQHIDHKITSTEAASNSKPTPPSNISKTPILQEKTKVTKPNITPPKVTTLPFHAQNLQDDPVIQHQNEEDFSSWEPPIKLEIPNVITPNGDGINDLFIIKGIEHCSKRQLTIRNRSGKIVYRNNAYENNWGGEGCTDGVYSYQFNYNTGHVDQNLSGNLTIIRK